MLTTMVEAGMESRVSRLESDVANIRADVTEMKTDIRNLRVSIDDVKQSIAALALRMEQSLAARRIARVVDRIWWLLVAGAMLGVMARGFQWI